MVIHESDEELNRIREVRHCISEQFGHDPYRLVAYYMEVQREHPEKLVPAPDSEFANSGVGDRCPPEGRPPINGAELVDYWQREGLIGSRPDLLDSLNHARALRAEAERRAKS